MVRELSRTHAHSMVSSTPSEAAYRSMATRRWSSAVQTGGDVTFHYLLRGREQNERRVSIMTHRECVKVPFSCGDALEWLGHGEVLTAAVSAGVEEDGRSMRYDGLERAQGSSGGSWVLGEAKGKHWGGRKDMTVANFAVALKWLVGVFFHWNGKNATSAALGARVARKRNPGHPCSSVTHTSKQLCACTREHGGLRRCEQRQRRS